MKIEPTTCGYFGSISIFPWAREPTETEILTFSETDFRDNYDLCMKAINNALSRLPPGFYTLVYPDGDVEDFCVGKGGGVRFQTARRHHQEHYSSASVPSNNLDVIVRAVALSRSYSNALPPRHAR